MKPKVHILPWSLRPQETISPDTGGVLTQAAIVRGSTPVTPLYPAMRTHPSFPSNLRALPLRPGTECVSNDKPPSSVPGWFRLDESPAVFPDVSSNFQRAVRCGSESKLVALVDPRGEMPLWFSRSRSQLPASKHPRSSQASSSESSFRTAKGITVRCTLSPTGRGQGEGCENPPVIPFAVLTATASRWELAIFRPV